MYLVKQVAALTGVPEATLRVWERRYGVVSPKRSPGGYRLYDEAQLQTLRRMAALVAGGVPASRAAQTALAVADEPGASEHQGWPDRAEFLSAAASLDSTRMASVIDAALESASFDDAAQHWIQPQLVHLGDAWEDGDLSVSQEHFASAALMRAMSAVFNNAESAPNVGPVLVGLPSGDHHQLALMAFATCLRLRGVDVSYLGPDVPLPDWIQAATHSAARAAVIGVTHAKHIPAAQKLVDELLALTPPMVVWTGGSRRDDITGATALPDGVTDAATQLQLALSGGMA